MPNGSDSFLRPRSDSFGGQKSKPMATIRPRANSDSDQMVKSTSRAKSVSPARTGKPEEIFYHPGHVSHPVTKIEQNAQIFHPILDTIPQSKRVLNTSPTNTENPSSPSKRNKSDGKAL